MNYKYKVGGVISRPDASGVTIHVWRDDGWSGDFELYEQASDERIAEFIANEMAVMEKGEAETVKTLTAEAVSAAAAKLGEKTP